MNHTKYMAIAAVLVLTACDSRRPTDHYQPESPAEPVAEKVATTPTPSSEGDVATPENKEIMEATKLPQNFELLFNHEGTCDRCMSYRVHMHANGDAIYSNTSVEVSDPSVGTVLIPEVTTRKTLDEKTMLDLAKAYASAGFFDVEQNALSDDCALSPGHRPKVKVRITWDKMRNTILTDHSCNVGQPTATQLALHRAEQKVRAQARLGEHIQQLKAAAIANSQQQ